jgi:hypothetical protein
MGYALDQENELAREPVRLVPAAASPAMSTVAAVAARASA